MYPRRSVSARVFRGGILCAASLALSAGLPAHVSSAAAQAVSGTRTVRASLSNDGSQVYRGSTNAVISRNGRFVAFTSSARALTNGNSRYGGIYVRDLIRRRTWLVSRGNDGRPLVGGGWPVAVTNTGRFVMFEFQLRAFDPKTTHNVFVRDRLRGRTHTVDAIPNWDGTIGMDISENGRYATFLRAYSGTEQLLQRNLVTRTTHLIATGGNTPGGDMLWGGFFARDGSMIFYTNHNVLYVHRRGEKHDWSVISPFRGAALADAITPDGRYLLFDESQPDMTTGFLHSEVYRYDRVAHTCTRISVGVWPYTSDPTAGGMSNDGRYVAFVASGDGYSPGDTDQHSDLLIRDLSTNVTTRASVANSGADFPTPVGTPLGRVLSADGSIAIFWTKFPAVSRDTNGVMDVFARIGMTDG